MYAARKRVNVEVFLKLSRKPGKANSVYNEIFVFHIVNKRKFCSCF